MSQGIDFAYLKGLIYDWVSTQAGSTPVIWADQAAPPPDGLFLTLKITSRIQIGQDYVGDPDEVTGLALKRGDRELMLSIQGFGDGALQALADIEEAFNVPLLHEDLEGKNIAVIGSNGLSDITGLFGSFREERASIDVRLRVAVPFYEEQPGGVNVGVIESTDMEGTVDGHTITINVQS